MPDSRDLQALQIFEKLLDAAPDQHAQMIESACGDDDQLRSKLEAMLDVHGNATDSHASDDEEHPPSSAVDSLVGRTIGDFTIDAEIGRGGMGAVYRARQNSLGRTVALKVLSPHLQGTPQARIRFRREVEAAATLRHPSIVDVFTTGDHDGLLYYAMELVDGPSLSDIIEVFRGAPIPALCETPTSRQRLPKQLSSNSDNPGKQDLSQEWYELFHGGDTESSSSLAQRTPYRQSTNDYFEVIAALLADVADGLACAHRENIVHRDIKPSNLLLADDGRVRISDFGLARNILVPGVTQTGEVIGTPFYMAPEQVVANSHIDGRTDIYSLGATLFELLTLQPPFPGDTRDRVLTQIVQCDPVSPRRINRRVPRDLETICLKAIEHSPHRRYDKAEELADDLRRFVAHKPLVARRSGLIDHSAKWIERHRALAATILGFVILASIGVVVASLSFALEVERHNKELKLAQAEERKALRQGREKYYESLYRQAQAERFNRETGRRDQALAAISEAAGLLPMIIHDAKTRRSEQLKLRNEAAAAFQEIGFAIDQGAKAHDPRAIGFSLTKNLYVLSADNAEIRRVSDDQLVSRIPQLEFRATFATFSPDGRYIAMMHRKYGQNRRQIRVWDRVEESDVLLEDVLALAIRFSPVASEPLAPDLAVLVDDRSVCVYPNSRADEVRTRDFAEPVHDICFSVDGMKVAAVGNERRIHLWEHADNNLTALSVPDPIRAVTWNSSQGLLAAGTVGGDILLLQPDERTGVIAKLSGHGNSIHTLALSRDSRLLGSASWDGTTRFWDIIHRQEFQRLRNQQLMTDFFEDGRFVCRDDLDKTRQVCTANLDSPRIAYSSRSHIRERRGVAFSPTDERLAAVATGDGTAIWDLSVDKVLQRLPTQRTFSVQFSGDGTTLLTSGRTGLQYWKSSTQTGPRSIVEGQWTLDRTLISSSVFHAHASSDLQRIAVIRADHHVDVISAETPEEAKTLETTGNIHRVAISPVGRWIVPTASAGTETAVYDAVSGKRVLTLCDSSASLVAAFSSDGQWLVGADPRKRFLWSTESWEEQWSEEHGGHLFGAVAISPDGSTVVLPRDRFHHEIVDRESRETLLVIETGDNRYAESAGFSPSGDRLSFSKVHQFDVWDIPDLRQRLRTMQLDW